MKPIASRAAIHRPQLSRRVVGEVAFGPLGVNDARQLATGLCEVPIADEAIRELCKTTGGSVGLLVRGLADLERLARKSGSVKMAGVAAA